MIAGGSKSGKPRCAATAPESATAHAAQSSPGKLQTSIIYLAYAYACILFVALAVRNPQSIMDTTKAKDYVASPDETLLKPTRYELGC
jgi:hypothetical protein